MPKWSIRVLLRECDCSIEEKFDLIVRFLGVRIRIQAGIKGVMEGGRVLEAMAS